MRALVEYFVSRSIFVNLLTVILMFGGGIVATVMMNREAFPNIDFDIVSVTTVYPRKSKSWSPTGSKIASRKWTG